MLTEELANQFTRGLSALTEEIKAFKNEELIWQVPEGISNSSGNLCLHIIGNLNHFIGSVIGDTGYIRQRDAEFSAKNIPVADLLEQLQRTSVMIVEVLSKMDANLLDDNYPIDVMKHKMTYRFFLIHLIGHLEYHRGQVNYLRRITDKA